MILDVHVHAAACTPSTGVLSRQLLARGSMRFVCWRFGLVGSDASTERAYTSKLLETLDTAPEIDAAVVLAFDSVYTPDGQPDPANTHFVIRNQTVANLARRHPKVLFGASVHPYRPDAIEELERCVKLGAVLIKWLPPTQGINPADERCIPFYEALAHYKLPLLSHTGGENALPTIDRSVEDPMLLEPALHRGVTVIAAHCGTRSLPGEPDYLPQFMHLARQYEHFYGDTSALNLPVRAYAYDAVLQDPVVRQKLLHGSDWPIIAIPPVRRLGMAATACLMQEPNWMRRDVLIKQELGFDRAYWRRAARVLGIAPRANPPADAEPDQRLIPARS